MSGFDFFFILFTLSSIYLARAASTGLAVAMGGFLLHGSLCRPLRGGEQMMLLTKAQAEAVYSAMCALNNVGAATGRVRIDLAVVAWGSTGASVELVRSHRDSKAERENYADQSAFAAAYGLQQG